MVLDKHRGIVDWIVVPLSRVFRNVNPNSLTWISFPFAIAAGVLYYLSDPASDNAWLLVFLALTMVGFTSLFDLLDGKVAKMYDKATKKGDYLDHVIDRFSDVVIFAGVAFSAWTDLRVGFFAMTGVLLTSYMGTQAQAMGMKRNYGGILGRADRLALLSIASAFDIIRLLLGYGFPSGWVVGSALDATMWWYAIAGNFTAVQRFYQGLRWFDRNAQG